MDTTTEAAPNTSNSLLTINRLLNEDEQKAWRNEAHLKYTKLECENVGREIKNCKAKIRDEGRTHKKLEDDIASASRLQELETQTIDLGSKLHLQLVQRKIDADTKLKDWSDKCDSAYNKHLEKFEQFKRNMETKNPLLKELRTLTHEVTKLELDNKICSQRVTDARRRYRLKQQIYQKIFCTNIVNFVEAIQKYHHGQRLTNELKDAQTLLEKLHKAYQQKSFNKESKNTHNRAKVPNKIEISNLKRQPSMNLPQTMFRSILPIIPPIDQNLEASDMNFTSIFNKYKEKTEKRKILRERLDSFELGPKERLPLNWNVFGAKRSSDNAECAESAKRLFVKPRTETFRLPGIMKKNVQPTRFGSTDGKVSSSQKSIVKRVAFDVQENTSKETTDVEENGVELQVESTQSNKADVTSQHLRAPTNVEQELKEISDGSAVNTNFNFGNCEKVLSQNFEKPSQVVAAPNPENLGSSVMMPPSNGFGGNLQIQAPRSQTITENALNYATTPGRMQQRKPSFLNSSMNERSQFSQYFKKSDPVVQNAQSNSKLFDKQDETKDTSSNCAESVDYDSQAEQYLPYEFLSPADEDKLADTSKDQSCFLFNLGQPSSQNASINPFSFFN